jgi:hypothetical protein
MSSIGRVFIVLNLLLSGAFVMFAGMYLQRADDWKKKHDTVAETLDTERKAHELKTTELTTALNAAERNLRGTKQQADNFENQVKEKTNDLAAQEARLGELIGEIGKLQASYSTMEQEIKNATAHAKQAREDWMKADQAKTAAVGAQEKAESSLGEANAKISELERTLADANAKIAGLDQSVREKDMLLSIARTKLPGIFANAAPTLDGRVENVSPAGDLVTIQITNNPGEAEIKPGYSMAIWDNGSYKGEVVITEAKDNFVFGRVTRRMENASLKVGDRASTNPAGL